MFIRHCRMVAQVARKVMSSAQVGAETSMVPIQQPRPLFSACSRSMVHHAFPTLRWFLTSLLNSCASFELADIISPITSLCFIAAISLCFALSCNLYFTLTFVHWSKPPAFTILLLVLGLVSVFIWRLQNYELIPLQVLVYTNFPKLTLPYIILDTPNHQIDLESLHQMKHDNNSAKEIK